MSRSSGSASFWRTIRGLPDRTPLWVKLTAAVLVLVTAALTLISAAGIGVLRGYLLHQNDTELASLAANGRLLENQVAFFLATGQAPQVGYSVQWLPSHGSVVETTGQVVGYDSMGQPVTRPIVGPTVTRGAGWLNNRLTPSTVGSANGGRWRVISARVLRLHLPFSAKTFSGTIIIGINVDSVYRTVGELTAIDLIVSAALLVLLAVLAVGVIRASMHQLTDIERTAEAIAAGDLTRRVPERDPRTEVGKLGMSLNTMLAHIETSFQARTASEEAARRSEEAARRSAAAAGRSEDRMRRFVADASHELRTPLTAIRGYAEYYRQRGGVETGAANGAQAQVASPAADELASAVRGALTRPDLDHLIQRVEQEATRMGVLVDDMLLLARLDQERPLDIRTVDLLAIAADALHDARVIAPERTITLTVGTPEAALVLGDEVGLRQVVGNLMNNAMMHTPNGTPIDMTIRVTTLPDGRAPADPGEPAVVLEVADRGPGLTDDQREHVFERFYRTDRARSRSAGGTGLGLAIVSAMVTAHHGKVWVDSAPGRGATFGFALPLAPEARFNSA